MVDRFDKFTQRARNVMTLAHEEAIRHKHNFISTEHILLGLLNERDSIAARVLTNFGVDLSTLRSKVEDAMGRGDRRVNADQIKLTERARVVIELAVDEARVLHHTYIGTEHLLLGLVREGEGIAAATLSSFGISLQPTRNEVTDLMSLSARSQEPEAPPPPGLPPMDSATRAEALIAELGREEALNLMVDLARLLRDPDSQEPEAPPPGLPPMDPETQADDLWTQLRPEGVQRLIAELQRRMTPPEEPDAPSPEDQ